MSVMQESGPPGRGSDPPVGRCPGGRGVPDHGGVRCGERELSGVLRLAAPLFGAAVCH